jgi:hypothetical protein
MICRMRQSRRDSDAESIIRFFLVVLAYPGVPTGASHHRSWRVEACGFVHNAREFRVVGYFFSRVLWIVTGSVGIRPREWEWAFAKTEALKAAPAVRVKKCTVP